LTSNLDKPGRFFLFRLKSTIYSREFQTVIENDDQVATLLDLGCVAGQGFLFAGSSSLEDIAKTTFMARRARLRAERAAYVDLTATGRYRCEELHPRSAAG
jgi:hypothetical protein